MSNGKENAKPGSKYTYGLGRAGRVIGQLVNGAFPIYSVIVYLLSMRLSHGSYLYRVFLPPPPPQGTVV